MGVRWGYLYDDGQNGPNLDGGVRWGVPVPLRWWSKSRWGVPVPEKTWLDRKRYRYLKKLGHGQRSTGTGTWKTWLDRKRYRYVKKVGVRENILAEPCPVGHRYPSIVEVPLLGGNQDFVCSWDDGIWLSFIEGMKRRNAEQFWIL